MLYTGYSSPAAAAAAKVADQMRALGMTQGKYGEWLSPSDVANQRAADEREETRSEVPAVEVVTDNFEPLDGDTVSNESASPAPTITPATLGGGRDWTKTNATNTRTNAGDSRQGSGHTGRKPQGGKKGKKAKPKVKGKAKPKAKVGPKGKAKPKAKVGAKGKAAKAGKKAH